MRKVFLLYLVATSVYSAPHQNNDQTDTPVVDPKCDEIKPKWNGWKCVCPDHIPYFNESSQRCIECTSGRVWNLDYEECSCPSDDQDFNEVLNICECSGDRIFDSTTQTCDCAFGREWDSITEQCKCPHKDQSWDFHKNVCECNNGRFWNITTEECECTGGRKWDSYLEECICMYGQSYNEDTNQCVCVGGKNWISEEKECACLSDFQWNGTFCVIKEKSCEIGKKWNGAECVPYCQKYEDWDGQYCKRMCRMNEVWDDSRRICIPQCSDGEEYDFNYKICHERCGENLIWNDEANECTIECPDKQILVEGKCLCPDGSYFNGVQCIEEEVSCPDGWKLGNNNRCFQIVSIKCPSGYFIENEVCIKKEISLVNCPPSYTYDEVAKKCLASVDPNCPHASQLVNGFCVEHITIRPDCPEGFEYISKKCIKFQESSCSEGFERKDGVCIEIQCPKGYIFKNNVCVLPKEIQCPNEFFLKDEICVRKWDDTCKAGFSLVDGICKRNIDENCPDDYILVDGKCKRSIETDCPKGFALVEQICKRIIDEACPDGLILINGVCKRELINDCPNGYILKKGVCNPVVAEDKCPDGFILLNDACVRECPRNYKYEEGRCVSIGSEDLTKKCNSDEIIVNEKCFKVICPDGFIIVEDKCMEISCPEGYVWFENSCKTLMEAGSGAVFEINNYIYNQIRNDLNASSLTPIENTNVVNVHVDGNNEDCESYDCNVEVPTIEETTSITSSLVETTPLPIVPKTNCCRIITPRICKKYDMKWLCYNKNFHDCSEFCVKSIVYLKPPKTIYKPPFLIVHPNPPVESCKTEDCKDGTIDCSGCTEYKLETCSSYCYDYHCVNRECTFFKQEDYCSKYPLSVGCSSNFGCIGDWCYGNTTGINPHAKTEKLCAEN